MSEITLYKNLDFKQGEIELPTSKSLSNRALIIKKLCEQPFHIHRLSTADDTQNLHQLLADDPENYDVGAAGTNMRFLISLLSIKEGMRILTGSNRMLERPIEELVKGLEKLGADITYLQKKGYPPVRIHGTQRQRGTLHKEGGISSQYISSLLMIAPCLQEGLTLEILNKQVSAPYIDMTLNLMQYFGITHYKSGNKISIAPQQYQPNDYTVEPDWSAAAFWYGFIANSHLGAQILLKNVSLNSLQGDKKTAYYFNQLGVTTTEISNGIIIKKTGTPPPKIHFTLIDEPDLFPALAFTCATLGIKASFDGLQNLNLKESKRIESVKHELEKTGAICTSGNDFFTISHYQLCNQPIIFDTYHDHRMAMAASIYSMSSHQIRIQNQEVVSKSYPHFWQDVVNLGIANIY